MPKIRCAIDFAMRKKRVQRRAKLLALARHHVDRVMQERVADLRSRFRHENAGIGLPSHQHGKGANVVLVRMRDEDRIQLSIRDGLEIRQRVLAHALRMHPAIEHKATAADLQIIRVRTDLGAAGEIDKFQGELFLLLLLLLLLSLA